MLKCGEKQRLNHLGLVDKVIRTVSNVRNPQRPKFQSIVLAFFHTTLLQVACRPQQTQGLRRTGA